MAKEKYFYESECDESEISLFVASNEWVNNFMHPNGFSLRRKTTTAQQVPERLIDKLIPFILHARRLSIKYKYPPSRIVPMYETFVWNDMVSNTTIDKQRTKSVCLKTTGDEKCMVSVCLAAKVDGTKLKAFVVFLAAKRESKSLDEEFKSPCVVKSSGNGWLNKELTTIWIKQVLGAFTFNRRLLAWDSCEYHMNDSVKNDLNEMNADSMIVPVQCKKYIKTPDVCWNKSLKARLPNCIISGLVKVSINLLKVEI